MASIGDTHDLNRLPPDGMGRTPSVPADASGGGHPLLYGADGEVLTRMPSVPTDEEGEIPLRARLDAIISAAKGTATPREVEALVEDLAGAHKALHQKHMRLQGEHSDVLGKLGQVLDAVGQIPTERPSRGFGDWQITDWTEQSAVLPASGEKDIFFRHKGHFPPRTCEAYMHIEYTDADDGKGGQYGAFDLYINPFKATRQVADNDTTNFDGPGDMMVHFDQILPYNGGGYHWYIDAKPYSRSGTDVDFTMRYRFYIHTLPEVL